MINLDIAFNRTNEILQGYICAIKIEDFLRGRGKNIEIFGGEALIFMTFFRGRPIFFRARLFKAGLR